MIRHIIATLPWLWSPRPGRGLGALLRTDTRRAYIEPTRASIERIELHPENVAEAAFALAQVVAVMRHHGDPRAVFPDVYGIITGQVAAELAKPRPCFLEPAWISRLVGYFAERYLTALDASLAGTTLESHAWALAFSEGRRGRTVPVLDAMLGINAHINFDLAQGLADNVRAAGTSANADMLARYKHDHDCVNLILRAAMPEIFDCLETTYGCRVSQQVSRLGARGPLTDFMLGRLARWREDVWDDLCVLLDPERASGRLELMNHKSERIARQLVRRPIAPASGTA